MTALENAYRKTALGGASGFGLMIALYDTLAGDLRRAAEAERRNDLEERTHQIKHALSVLAHLEDWIERGTGGELAEQLKGLYRSLRCRMIEAQANRSPEMLEEDMARILEIREIWQKAEMRGSISTAHVPGWIQAPSYPGSSLPMRERNSSRWTA
jgi:flagellar protein FliS